jgi:hypothetical protein
MICRVFDAVYNLQQMPADIQQLGISIENDQAFGSRWYAEQSVFCRFLPFVAHSFETWVVWLKG